MRRPRIHWVGACLVGGMWMLAVLVLPFSAATAAATDDPAAAQSPTPAPEPTRADPAADPALTGSPAAPSGNSGSTLQLVTGDEPQPTPASTKAPAERNAHPEPTAAQPGAATSASAPAEKSETPLEPIPEPDPAAPVKTETAGFNGIMPGRSTAAQLTKLWGAPKETRQQGGMTIQRYVVEPFERVEVSLSGDRVTSIVVRLQQAFPAQTVAQQLGLTNIRPVLVSNELGDILGQSYPERGVLFAFQQNQQPGTPSMQVTEIVLEPVAADSFVLRAETNLQSNFKQNLHDLDEALKLEPGHARAHWLRARVLAAMGRADEAVEASGKALELEGNDVRFRVSHAQILNQAGRHREAVAETARAITMSDDRPHVKARAQCLMGDLLGEADTPDWAAALKFHVAAIKTADPLAASRHPAIRLAAKEVLIDAHLGAANDIAWGRWGGKEKAIAEWVRRAGAFAEEMIANDGGTSEHRFRVASRALGACVGASGKVDPTDWVREAARVGNEMIAATPDADERRQARWEVGMALFNAVQVYQSRKEFDFALECGQQAVNYLEPAKDDSPLLEEQRYLLGRLYFRLGAIYALNRDDHTGAVAWFDRAAPLLVTPFSKQPDAELALQGETLVSMGVSYWEMGQQDRALELTKAGLAMVKQAVDGGATPKSALGVPYENLATIQKHLGHDQEAAEMTRLAQDAQGTIRAGQTGTAARQDEPVRR